MATAKFSIRFFPATQHCRARYRVIATEAHPTPGRAMSEHPDRASAAAALRDLESAPQPAVAFCEGFTFTALRPEVLPFLTQVTYCERWQGQVATFEGTQAELVGCGVATADMFEGKLTVSRTGTDAYGDKWNLRRRPRGQWHLVISLSNIPARVPTDEHPTAWWRANGAAVEAATCAILQRFVKATRESVAMDDLERRAKQAPCDFLKPQAGY